MRRSLVLLLSFAFVIFSATAAWAKDPATPELTLQQAVEMANTNSEALQIAQYNVDRSKKVKDYAQGKMIYAPTSPTTTTASNAFKSYVQSDISYQSAQKSYSAEEDTVYMETLKAYNTLLLDLEAVKVAEIQVKNAKWAQQVATVNKQVGMLDQLSMVQADTARTSAEANYESAQKALSDAYQQFNQLVGLWPEDRPVLVDKPVFEKVQIDNLDTEVERAVAASPTVWTAEQQINIAKITKSLYDLTSTSNSEPYDAKKIDISKAEVSATSTEEQVRELVRTIYYSMGKLEEQYAAAEDSLKQAQEALRVAQVKYDVGVATRTDVNTAQAQVATAEQTLLSVSSQYQILSVAFEKPWAYVG